LNRRDFVGFAGLGLGSVVFDSGLGLMVAASASIIPTENQIPEKLVMWKKKIETKTGRPTIDWY